MLGASVNVFAFTQSLSLGSRGSEVLELQIFLNQDFETQVSFEGPGSPGNETDYFGSLTKNAVIRFQEKYASEVLAPVGLSKGTGYVGPSTRQKLNSFSEEEPTLKGPLILRTQPGQAKPGSFISIYGEGFLEDDYAVIFPENKIARATKSGTTRLTFPVPQGVPIGKQPLFVREEKTGKVTNSISLIIVSQTVNTETGPKSPQIGSLSPRTGGKGTVLTITGEGFTQDNTILTGYTTLFGIPSSDGKTLTITLNPSWEKSLKPNITIPLWIYVENENGSSIESIFNYEL